MSQELNHRAAEDQPTSADPGLAVGAIADYVADKTMACPECAGQGVRRMMVAGRGVRQCRNCAGSGEVLGPSHRDEE